MKRNQKTIKEQIEFSGIGLHTGKEIQVCIKPAPVNTGVVLTRTDLPDQPQIPAGVDFVTNILRRTALKNGTAEVHTTEHLFAALTALQIDNLEIELDAEEIPGMDGSSGPFFDLLSGVTIVEQKAEKKSYQITEPIVLAGDDCSITALPAEEGVFSISYSLDYQDRGLPPQFLKYSLERDTFRESIAPARTFCFAEEAEALLDAGHGKGASYENTLVIKDGAVMENKLRFADEFVRHKILDLIGDLYLVNADLSGHFVAVKTGHDDNIGLARKIVDEIQLGEVAGTVSPATVMDIQEVFGLLPHRYPFLLIDRVIELEGYRRAVGIKNVTINEPFFQGHFPGQPIMPGVLILEAMAQLAGVVLLRRLENTGKLAVLWAIDKVKLRKSVIPGDQLRIEIEATKVKDQVGRVQAWAKVNQKIVAEAVLTFTLVDAA